MKKLRILFLLLLLSLTACSTKVRDESAQTQPEKSQNTDVVLTETENGISEAEAAWDFSEIHGSEEGFIVSAQDLYNDGGWGCCNR